MSDGARPPRREPRRENQHREVRGDALLIVMAGERKEKAKSKVMNVK